MTAYDVWQYLCPDVEFGAWTLPPWFRWPNTLTPAQVDRIDAAECELAAEAGQILPRVDLGGCNAQGCGLSPAVLHEQAMAALGNR